MFSKLDDLKIDDIIYITDIYGNKLEYKIYDIYIIDKNNLDCLKNNNTIREVTLITCNNNDNSKRLIIKGKNF